MGQITPLQLRFGRSDYQVIFGDSSRLDLRLHVTLREEMHWVMFDDEMQGVSFREIDVK